MRERSGKHSCMSSQFPIAILNGTSFFLSLMQAKLHMPSGHYYRLCSWSGRSNHLIKNSSEIYFLLIEFHFTLSVSYKKKLFINIVFWLRSDRPSGLLPFVPVCLFSVLPSPCASVWENTLARVPQFPIAILNGISFFLSLVQEKLNMPSGHYYMHCSLTLSCTAIIGIASFTAVAENVQCNNNGI